MSYVGSSEEGEQHQLSNMATKALKQVFRKQVKAAIRALSEEEKTRQSEILVKRVRILFDVFVLLYISLNLSTASFRWAIIKENKVTRPTFVFAKNFGFTFSC